MPNNTIDRLRIEMGVSRPKMIELLRAKPGRVTLLTASDDQIDAIFFDRAQELRSLYSTWINGLNQRLNEFEALGFTEMTCVEVQELLSLRDFHITQLRSHNLLQSIYRGSTYVYPITGLRKLIEDNSGRPDGKRRVRGPLALGFLRWLGKYEAGGLDYAASGRVAPTAPTAPHTASERIPAGVA